MPAKNFRCRIYPTECLQFPLGDKLLTINRCAYTYQMLGVDTFEDLSQDYLKTAFWTNHHHGKVRKVLREVAYIWLCTEGGLM